MPFNTLKCCSRSLLKFKLHKAKSFEFRGVGNSKPILRVKAFEYPFLQAGVCRRRGLELHPGPGESPGGGHHLQALQGRDLRREPRLCPDLPRAPASSGGPGVREVRSFVMIIRMDTHNTRPSQL